MGNGNEISNGAIFKGTSRACEKIKKEKYHFKTCQIDEEDQIK
jgi:hypothetical protein